MTSGLETNTSTRQSIPVAPGAWLYRDYLSPEAQALLLAALREGIAQAPLFVPRMPRTNTPFSVRMTNFGPLGWVSDIKGYRYQAHHPDTGAPWPPIPLMLIDLWNILLSPAPEPQACLINFYTGSAKMGLHQDRDETALDVPVLSISLGDTARFRIGGLKRRDPSQAFVLNSGDVFVFGGESRLAFHGIDRIYNKSSQLLPEGGRLNITLRRVISSEVIPEMRSPHYA